MITLIVNSNVSGINRKVYEYLTLRELGIKIVELSENYILAFDCVRNIEAEIVCEMTVTIVTKR